MQFLLTILTFPARLTHTYFGWLTCVKSDAFEKKVVLEFRVRIFKIHTASLIIMINLLLELVRKI